MKCCWSINGDVAVYLSFTIGFYRERSDDHGAHQLALQLRPFEMGNPNKNALIEFFNGRLRDESLKGLSVTHLLNARTVINGGANTTTSDRRRPCAMNTSPLYTEHLRERTLHFRLRSGPILNEGTLGNAQSSHGWLKSFTLHRALPTLFST